MSGHPGEQVGCAVGAGIKLNSPMIGPGDYLQAQTHYTEGALELHLPDRQLQLGQG